MPSAMPLPRAPCRKLGIKFGVPRSDPFSDEKTEAQGKGSDLLRATRRVRDEAGTCLCHVNAVTVAPSVSMGDGFQDPCGY